MNNSKIITDNPVVDALDTEERLRTREGELARIVESLGKVALSDDWRVLQESIFDGSVSALERQLILEAKKPEINSAEIYRLQGQLAWAKTYANLEKLADKFRSELANIRHSLHVKRTEDGASYGS